MDEISWKECIENGIIFETIPDLERSLQLLSMAETRFLFWNKKVNKKFITLKVEGYYEIIKELIFALIYKNGFNCKNHICLIAYLQEKHSELIYEIDKINELRKIRNDISYRGFYVDKDYLDRNELEFKNIINILINKVKQ